MAKIKGFSFIIKKDVTLKKGTQIYFITDENKFWLKANDNQITFPRQGNKDKEDNSRIWINK